MSSREYPVPHVEYIRIDGGTSPHPQFEQSWSDGEKLAWHAACVMAETGLEIHVYDANHRTRTGDGPWRAIPGQYSFTVRGPGTSLGISGMDYRSAWVYLDGISTGAHAAHPKELDS